MTSQDSQGAGTHMDIEGRSRDSTVLTALAQTHVVPYQRDRLKCYHFNPHSFYAGPSGAVPATVTAWISALCWLQQCLFGSRSIAFRPLSTKLVSVTLTATKGRKACGTLSSLHPGHFGQPPDNRCHHTPKQAVSQLHMVTLWWGASFFLPHPC